MVPASAIPQERKKTLTELTRQDAVQSHKNEKTTSG